MRMLNEKSLRKVVGGLIIQIGQGESQNTYKTSDDRYIVSPGLDGTLRVGNPAVIDFYPVAVNADLLINLAPVDAMVTIAGRP